MIEGDPIEMFDRVADGCAGPAELRWLTDSFAKCRRGGYALAIETCLRIPATRHQRLLHERNAWLLRAAQLVQADATPGGAAAAIAAAYSRFLSRGPWRVWLAHTAPPADTSALHAALFHIAKANHGAGLSERQIRRVIGHKKAGKCQPISFII